MPEQTPEKSAPYQDDRSPSIWASLANLVNTPEKNTSPPANSSAVGNSHLTPATRQVMTDAQNNIHDIRNLLDQAHFYEENSYPQTPDSEKKPTHVNNSPESVPYPKDDNELEQVPMHSELKKFETLLDKAIAELEIDKSNTVTKGKIAGLTTLKDKLKEINSDGKITPKKKPYEFAQAVLDSPAQNDICRQRYSTVYKFFSYVKQWVNNYSWHKIRSNSPESLEKNSEYSRKVSFCNSKTGNDLNKLAIDQLCTLRQC